MAYEIAAKHLIRLFSSLKIRFSSQKTYKESKNYKKEKTYVFRLDKETVWLTQSQISELFQRDQSVIAWHIRNIFREKELDEESNMHFLHNTLDAPSEGIFYDGQIFDAYTFVADLIRSVRKSIALIDNYVDDTVLKLLSKRAEGVSATIFTRIVSALCVR